MSAPSPQPAPLPAPLEPPPAGAPFEAPDEAVGEASGGALDHDTAADLEVSLTSYYQKYLGRARPDTQAFQMSYPWWALFFGVLPVPVLPAEGEYVAQAIQARIETGRFDVLPVGQSVGATGEAVGQHLEAVALARARVEAEQEGRYNTDLKGLDIYRHHLDEIRGAGYVYRMTLTDLAVLTDRGLSRWVAWASCRVELYRVVLGDPARVELIDTLIVDGGGVAINVLKALDSGQRAGLGGPALAALGSLPRVPAPALVPLGVGGTLLGGLGARGLAMSRAVRSMLDYLDVALAREPGFRLEAPITSVDGRRITFPMGTFEGLDLDDGFDVYVVAPRGEGGCPEGMDEEPAPGACGERVGYARVRRIADNTDPDGGRRTPEREEVKVLTGESEAADLRPFDSTARVLMRHGMPRTPLGLKVYERPDSGHRLLLQTGLLDGADGPTGRFDLTWRRSVSDVIPVSELSFDLNLGLQAGGATLLTGMAGLDKRLYVNRLGVGFGARVGLGLAPDGCDGCRAVGGEVYAGLEFMLSRRVALEANVVAQRFERIDASPRSFQSIGGLAGLVFMW